MPALGIGRRQFALGVVATLAGAAARAQERRFRVAFANLTEDAGVRLEGLGFTGPEVRRSFELAARTLPVEMFYFDNAGDGEKAIANAAEAVERRVDLLIEYNADLEANGEIARKMQQARIPVLAINYPVPGAPLYASDNVLAGRVAGTALAEFAKQNWMGQNVAAVIIGDLSDPAGYVGERMQGIRAGVRESFPQISFDALDTSGNPIRAESLLGKFLAAQLRRKILVATLDDATALAAKAAIESAGRAAEAAIVGQGVDRSMHGGASEKKELDPNNRGSIILGSVAYYLDRYGYDVLPLALRMLRGEPVPGRTATRHVLITQRNIFSEYPPRDMN